MRKSATKDQKVRSSMFAKVRQERVSARASTATKPKTTSSSMKTMSNSAYSYDIVQEEKQEERLVHFKSIFLDLLERYKTIENICKACPQLTQSQVQNLPENLLFRLRKFYSIGDVTASPLFRHLKVSNFYDQQRVCFYCSHVYDKIDTIRNEHLIKKRRKQIDHLQIQRQVDKYLQGGVMNSGHMHVELKKRMSDMFFEKLKDFDVDKELFQQQFQVTTTVQEKYFQRKQPKGQKNVFSLTQSQDNQNFQLPVIYKYSLKDTENVLRKQAYYVKPDQAEALGLKHYLGHVKNLPYSDQGLAISKSSLELNKLQDKIRDIEHLKERIENERIMKIREEIELVMCTYYGNGKANHDRLVDFIDTLKKREIRKDAAQETRSAIKQIQIVTDKNDFLSENQKKQKQDKEKKELEIQESKKNFMELNSQLASSVKRVRRHESPSPLRQLDYISEDSEMY